MTGPAGVTLAGLGSFLAIGAVLPVLPRYVQGPVGGGELAAGVVYGVFALSALAGRPVAGLLSDRYGGRAVLAAGLAITAVAGALLFVPLGVPSLIVARLVVGAGEAFTAIGGTILAIELAEPDRRGRAIGLFGLAFWLGLSLGAIAGEGLFRIGGYETVWVFTALVPVAGLALMRALGMPEERRPRPARQPLLPPRAALLPGVLLGLGGYGYAAMAGFGVLHMDAEGVHGGFMVLAVFAFTAIGLRAVWGNLPDRLGPQRGPAVALVSQAAGLAVLAPASSLTVALPAAALVGLGTSLMFPSLALLVLERVEPERRAAAIGGFSAFLDLGVLISGPASGALAAAAGYDVAFAVAAASSVVGAAVYLLGRARLRRAVAPHPLGVLPPDCHGPAPEHAQIT